MNANAMQKDAPPAGRLAWHDMAREDRTAAIRAGKAAGKTAADIADSLRTTRNAIIGWERRYIGAGFGSGAKAVAPPPPPEPTKWKEMNRAQRVAALRAGLKMGKVLSEIAADLSTRTTALQDLANAEMPGEIAEARRANRAHSETQRRANMMVRGRLPEPRPAREPVDVVTTWQPAAGEGVPFLELGHRDCRAPAWTEEQAGVGDYRFCGAGAIEGSSYCPAHHAKFYAGGQQKAPSAPRESRVRGVREAMDEALGALGRRTW